MTESSGGESAATPDWGPRWRIAVAVLVVVTLTLLVINVVLRSRVDSARSAEVAASAQTEQLQADNADLANRNEELLNQLSTSNERLTGLTDRLSLSKKQLAAADANVQRQVTAQKAAERAVRRADAGVRKARAQTRAAQAQLRNAQTCSVAGIRALTQIHSGPDIESGADKAASTLEAALPACRAGLG